MRSIRFISSRCFVLIALALIFSCTHQTSKRVIVLGVDGADPTVLKRLMDEGKLPHFRRLAEKGDFRTLGTSNPPQSPVAWATFATGLDPGGHGIFDFVHRNPESMKLEPGMSRLDGSGKPELQRRGRPFWAYLQDRGIESTLINIAVNFPPDGSPGKLLTGMGTPDLTGSYGTFTYYTSAGEEAPEDLTGGPFVRLIGREGVMTASLVGPSDETVPLEFIPGDRSALIRVGPEKVLLKVGEWSGWQTVHFTSGSGMVRFYLKSSAPDFRLYASPVNIDPCDPVQSISAPPSYSRHLCRCCGRYYTQGMPEDTKALVHGVLNDHEFLSQSNLVLEERKALFEQGLAEFKTGLFFFYLSTTDIVSHLYWSTIDPAHPGFQAKRAGDFGEAIEQAYIEADGFVGRLLEEEDSNTSILVISDHGFAPFHRAFGLNAWLQSEGYLTRSENGTDWTDTKAYGVGFNGLYLNLKGRERQGRVSLQERKALLEEISNKLLSLRDPESGRPVVKAVYKSEDIYAQQYQASGPDLVVGYARGYRASWQTVLGDTDGGILSDNLDLWSGDHLMDPSVVPGILLSNVKLGPGEAELRDIAPTVLALFEIPRPEEMKGKDLFQDSHLR